MNKSTRNALLLLALLSAGCQGSNTHTKNQSVTSSADKVIENGIENMSASDLANKFYEDQFQLGLSRSPMYQSYLGIKDNADKWDDESEKAAQEDHQLTKDSLKLLKKSFNFNKLDKPTQLSYRLFKQQSEEQIESFQFRFHNYPVNQMFGTHADAPAFLINIHQVGTVKDAQDYIARLQGFTGYFDQLIVNLKERQKLGILPPKFVFNYVIDDSKNIITGKPFDNSAKDSTLLEDFSKKVNALEISDKEKSDLISQANKALIDNVKPAYEKLIVVAKAQQTVANNDDGVWKLPNGAAFYKNRLKRITTTDLTADQIHEIGLSEVARIHDEMRGIMKQVKFEGTLQEFFTFMGEDKQFYFSNDKAGKDEYINQATDLIETMKGSLDSLFITKPKADLVVKAVEPFREKSAGTAFYQRPAPDGSRPGTYYANTYDMMAMPKYEMEALAYHEGLPGHHMQLSIAQELGDIPKFRKYGGYTAYIEGWGLYSEMIPKEMGFYTDPYSDFGRLSMELWRACRLVVDTGIHDRKWTRQQGIDFYSENTPSSLHDVIKMVERHVVMPGQATAYKVGMLKIVELREKAKTALGDAFDIREFHDQVLTDGALPLSILEEKINNWITSKS